MIRVDRRNRIWGASVLLLAMAPALAGYVGLSWEISQLAGLISTLACIVLCGCPMRPRDAEPPTLLGLKNHQILGWVALIAAVLHLCGLLLVDGNVVEYLKLTTPLYQWSGILALVLLLIIVLSSIAGARRRLWNGHRGFQATHVSLGCALLVLVATHVSVTHRYMGGGVRQILFGVATIGALLLLLRSRRVGNVAVPTVKARRLVFGRHSKWVACVVVVASAAVAAALLPQVKAPLREPIWQREIRLPLDFPHEKHATINCLICHHNYADGRGADSCVPCHRSARADLRLNAEARFHGFCFDCHRHPDPVFKKHGPVAGCEICHRLASGGQAASDAATPLK